jgi:hypothetical protein
MTNHELLTLMAGKAGLWLAGIAACAGLALAWRWWVSRRILRNRALQMLGFNKPTGSAVGPGVRYAGVVAAAIVTIFVLTPTTPGAGDADPAAEVVTPATAPPSQIVIVEVRAGGATIVLQGNTVEIRMSSGAPTPAMDASSIHPSGDIAAPRPTATAPASALPEGME